MYELKKNGKIFTSKFVGTGPSSYEKRIYRAAVSRRLRIAVLEQVSLLSTCWGAHLNGRNIRGPLACFRKYSLHVTGGRIQPIYPCINIQKIVLFYLYIVYSLLIITDLLQLQ